MKRTISSLLVAPILVVSTAANAQLHQWSKGFGSWASNFGYSVATDPSGNVFVTGSFQDTVDFGGGPLVSVYGRDIFVAKFDAAGTHLWSQRFGGEYTEEGRSVATDPSGNVLVIANFEWGAFVAKFSPSGTLLWSQGPGGIDIVLAKYAVIPFEPTITSIADIGNDQGRTVKIRFVRSGYDLAGSLTPVLQYGAYRRDDAPPASFAAGRNPEAMPQRTRLDDGWTQVGTVAAHGKTTYGIDVPTIGDSTEVSGQYYSTFFIRATTTTPTTFFDSPPDSGYSLDNLAPGVPGGLAYGASVLEWNRSSAEDFDYFSVYGSNTNSFAAATLVEYCVTPAMDVSGAPYVYYFVTATDFAGNKGKPAVVNTLSGVGGTPESYVLSISAYPNPFNPTTTIRYTVPSKGRVAMSVFDARGALVTTLVDAEKEAGAYTRAWNGRDGSGQAVSSGVYFARVTHGAGVKSYKMVLLK